MEALINLANKIENADLRAKIIAFLKDPTISIQLFGDELTIEEAPASKIYHHSYPRGLIEHIVGSTLIAIEIANMLQKVHQIDFINKDLIIAGGILHDIYKPLTYSKEKSIYERSRLGSKIDHTSLIFAEAWSRKFPLELLHIVLSHHGKGSSAIPRSLESLILHLGDYVDSNLLGDILIGAQKIAERAGTKISFKNSKLAAIICDIMAKEGIQGVKEYLATIKQPL